MLLLMSRFFEPDAGRILSAIEAAGPKVRQPQVWLPQERDARLLHITRVRTDRYDVRRRNVAKAYREHALSEWDDWSHHGLPLEPGGRVDDVQGRSQRDAWSEVAAVNDQTALGAAINHVADHDPVSDRADHYGYERRCADQIRRYGAGCRHLEGEGLCRRERWHCTRCEDYG